MEAVGADVVVVEGVGVVVLLVVVEVVVLLVVVVDETSLNAPGMKRNAFIALASMLTPKVPSGLRGRAPISVSLSEVSASAWGSKAAAFAVKLLAWLSSSQKRTRTP